MKFGEKRESGNLLAVPEQIVEQVEAGKEKEPSREKGPSVPEQPDAAVAKQVHAAPSAAGQPSPAAAAKDPYHARSERILEDNLVNVYLSMPPEARARFKAQGEAAALKIRAMLEQAKIKAKEVLKIVWQWLKTIPGVNRYFLEQEAKIKTDKIILLAEERRKEKEGQIA